MLASIIDDSRYGVSGVAFRTLPHQLVGFLVLHTGSHSGQTIALFSGAFDLLLSVVVVVLLITIETVGAGGRGRSRKSSFTECFRVK